MKEFLKSAMLWKLACFRCLLYAFAGMWSEFEHLTETWSQTTWHDTGTFELVRLFGHCLFTGGIVTILAFLDQTLSRGKTPPIIPPIQTPNEEKV